ncbi:MmgE/PrpD family protein [Pseudochelatococcus lubricantis]|uniref:MmgE/PrpD family protein n=1 Tax=Pseudochelatococcus lubricantis TaxID=1538102 RepID=UPI0035E662A9
MHGHATHGVAGVYWELDPVRQNMRPGEKLAVHADIPAAGLMAHPRLPHKAGVRYQINKRGLRMHTEKLAAAVMKLQYHDLPPEARDAARGAFLDGVGNILAGSREELGLILAGHAAEFRGAEIATVFGHGFKTTPTEAAFVNGAFCHALDFELMWIPPTHPAGTTLPAILALSEMLPISGTQAILALCAGFEVQGRFRLATLGAGELAAEGIHPPGLVGPMGTAASAARLLGLDQGQLRYAFGIAASRIGGLSANTGTMTKSTHSGHAARMGLEAALLARRGFTASASVFETQRGINEIFFHGKLDLDALHDGFAAPLRMVKPGLIVKRFPAQYTTHWVINAALDIHEELTDPAAQIDSVLVEAGANNPALHRLPQSGLDGKFSIPYTVAVALLDGHVRIDSFSDARWQGSDLRDMLGRITLQGLEGVNALDFENTEGRVTVRLRDGSEISRTVTRPRGVPDNPVSWNERLDKFRDCACRAVNPEGIDALITAITGLEELNDLSQLARLVDRHALPGADRA